MVSMTVPLVGDAQVSGRAELDRAAMAFVRHSEGMPGHGDREHWRAIALLGALMTAVASAETAGLDRADIVAALEPVRPILDRSPFIARVREWPRGYPGDFETVEYLIGQANRAEPASFGWHLEQYFLSSPMAQQHRNKIAHQSGLISHVLRDRPSSTPVAVLLLAAGGAADLRLVAREFCQDDDRIVLNDVEPDALAYAERTVGAVGRHCRYVPGNCLRVVAELAALGPYDLVLAGGLYDYLPDRAAGLLTRKVLGRLCKPGGTFFFSNISADNPFRLFTEYIAPWPLIGRCDDGLRRLVTDCGVPLSDVRLERDPTGITWLVQAVRERSRTGR